MSGGRLPAAAERRLAELGERYELPADGQSALAALLGLLDADPLAPTTVRDPIAAVDQHVADALVALELPELSAPGTIADLGAGAGIPGLVLAIARPPARVALVESNRRKCEFLERAVAETGVANVEVVNDRAETWSTGFGRQDVVTARALAPLAVLAEYAAPLLRVGGVLVAWTGRREPELEAEADTAAQILGMSGHTVIAVRPFARAEHRHLQVMSKLTPTPPGYPRRPGIARKRPLGAPRAPSDRERR